MISISNLSLGFPGFRLGPLSLEVDTGSFFALMGPTGSGKTLLLESLAGLLKPDQGTIHLNNRDISNEPPERRRMGLVYQDNALFPHMTVFENVVYGQRYHKIDRNQGNRHAYQLLEMLGISQLENRKPESLSGGEKQRTALARALACRPQVVLLDEPLSSLDPQFREGLRKNLKLLHETTGSLFFMVTHDFVDALSLTDSAAVIRNGVIEQNGATLDIFHRPATTFIADFVGMKNIFEARFEKDACCFAGLTLPLKKTPFSGQHGWAAIRPEDLIVSRGNNTGEGQVRFNGTINDIMRDGFTWLAVVRNRDSFFTARIEQRLLLNGALDENHEVTISFNPESVHYISE